MGKRVKTLWMFILIKGPESMRAQSALSLDRTNTFGAWLEKIAVLEEKDRRKGSQGGDRRKRAAARDFQAMVDRANAGSQIGEELLCCTQDLFTWWYQVRDGTLKRSTFRQYMGVVRSMVREQLEAGTVCGRAKTAGVCRELLTLEPALWTFVRVEGVEPTNNAAERALRHAVTWRKVSHGTASAGGSRFLANILSVVEACRQQGRNVLAFLTECCQAATQGAPHPSLVPASSIQQPAAVG
jgi:transposase